MAKLATCPGCTTQLALPEEATLSDEARCPRCGDEFPLMEVVQFSIPTAELIPASDRSKCSEVAEWAANTMVQEPLDVRTPVQESTAVDEAEIDEVQAAPPERAESDLTATLSDWEARLKRAISDTQPSESPESLSEGEISEPVELERGSARKSNDSLQDFSFPHEDLEPQGDSEPAPEATPWAAVETEEFDFDSAEPTVKTTSDHTVVHLAAPTTPDLEIDTTDQLTSPKKSTHSLSRTLLSASLGLIGIPLGLYALLWIKGPAADVAHLADYLPRVMLPASMQTPLPNLQEGEAELAQEESEASPSQDEQAMPPLVTDPEVQPATAEVPVYSGPRFALVESEEFHRLLTAAAEAAPELASGDLADQAIKKRKGHAYITLCRLADKCSFMNQPGLTVEDADQVAEAQELLEAFFTNPHVLADLPLIAGPWWEFEARPSAGAVLAGRVERVESTAAGSLARIRLGESGALVPVLIGGNAPRLGAQIGIVGSIVNDAPTTIPALSGVANPIVVAHFLLPIQGEYASETLK